MELVRYLQEEVVAQLVPVIDIAQTLTATLAGLHPDGGGIDGLGGHPWCMALFSEVSCNGCYGAVSDRGGLAVKWFSLH